MRYPSFILSGNRTTYFVVFVWTILVVVSLLAQREQLNRTAVALARIDAIANLKKDMTIRQWASSVGGVFIREKFAPALDSLEEEERLVAIRSTGESFRLVTVTPIHLLLAIQGASNLQNNKQESGIHERLTSNQLRNIENAPDDWETKALDALTQGGDIVVETLPKMGGHGLMRVMIPMRMEKECLDCHRDTLIPIGGLRGGAAVSINLNTYRAAQEPTWLAIRYWHLGIWIIGLVCIYTFGFFSRRRDIEKLQSEEERRENETAFASMSEGAIITDVDGTILWVNDAFCSISGYERNEVIRQNPRILKSGQHGVEFYQELWRQLSSVGHWRGEIWNKRKSGEVFPEEISIQALKGPDGKIRRFISIFSDISERKHNEKELQDYRDHLEDLVRQRTEELTVARDAAESANRTKSAFLANMSHELRTPLNAVIGFSQLMDKDPALMPNQRRNAEIINSSGNHLLTLINDILELSKIESGKKELHAESVDLTKLLEQIADMLRLRAEQKGIQLALVMKGLPPDIYVDPVILRQVLLNLLSNAVKFTTVGKVSLLVNGLETETGEVRLIFNVIDTGVGIHDEDLTRIFQPFEQAGGFNQEGTGLGLTISQQYVRMMGGELKVESEIGKGSVFSFSIVVPVCRFELRPTKPTRERIVAIAPLKHGYRVLLVDNMPEARLLLRTQLEALGFSVEEASSFAEAEATVGAGLTDLVFMDWFMPDGNGLDTIQRIRSRTDISQPVLVMLTAYALEESRQAAISAGADDFISKPYDENTLYGILEKHLPIRFTHSPILADNRPDINEHGISDDLAALAPSTFASLSEGALSLNSEQIRAALLAVERENPELAARLREFSNSHQYQALWQLLGILDEEA
ncbi:MAG: ATP-binding protein [Betaproteobacteria bacterium]